MNTSLVIRKNSAWLAILLALAFLLFTAPVSAQTEDETVSVENTAEIEDDSDTEEEAESEEVAEEEEEEITELDVDVDDETGEVVDTSLEDIEVDVPEEEPSNAGLWFRGLRERLSLLVTINPVKKAEKQVKFAEERMAIAERIAANSDNPKAQEKAQKVIERANKLFEKIEAKKEKWMEKNEEKVGKLLKNIANHQVRREKVMDKIESRLTDEQLEKFQERREQILEKGGRLLKAVNNDKVPENVRKHLKHVKSRIEGHATNLKDFKEKRAGLFHEAREGSEEAQAKLDELRANRKEKAADLREKAKEAHAELVEKKGILVQKAAEGDEEAKAKLNRLKEGKEKVEALIDNSPEKLKERVVRLEKRVKEKRVERKELGAEGIIDPIYKKGSKKIIDPIYKKGSDKIIDPIYKKGSKKMIDPVYKPKGEKVKEAVHKAVSPEEARKEMNKIKPTKTLEKVLDRADKNIRTEAKKPAVKARAQKAKADAAR